jgi:hypothetical protein
MIHRLGYYAAGLVVVFALAFALAAWGFGMCAPAPLPGDEGWAFRLQMLNALTLVTRGGAMACFEANGMGMAALQAAGNALWLMGALAVLMIVWETAGRAAWLGWLRARGGHTVLAGSDDDLLRLAMQQRKSGPVLFLAADAPGAAALSRRRPFAEVGLLGNRQQSTARLRSFGAGAARLVAATTRQDSLNRDLAELELDGPGKSDIVVRLEGAAVRAMSSHRLRLRAEEKGRRLAVLSIAQMQMRRGMSAAMPGRFTLEGNPRVHIAISGTGPGLQALSFDIARQGYGLERQPPVLSILRTGHADFSPGELERLVASDAAQVQVASAAASSPGAIDRAIDDVISGPVLTAIHCISDGDGEAEELALRWEAELVASRLPVPPIVAYAREARALGTTGMIRIADAPNLAEAREIAAVMDHRAMAAHQQFLDTQKAARGDKFGSEIAEVPWERLPELYRDDNRNVADQVDYKLARIFMAMRPGMSDTAPTAADIEMLAEAEHARWMAARALNGWRYGSPRDNGKRLHPDMIPYSELDEAARDKDRHEVRMLPALATLSGDGLLPESRVTIPEPLPEVAISVLAKSMTSQKGRLPVAVLALDSAAIAETALALLRAGVEIEAVIDPAMADVRLAGGGKLVAIADVLRRAWRVHVVIEGSARAALAARGKTDA